MALLFGLFFLIGVGAFFPVMQNFIDAAAPNTSVSTQAILGLFLPGIALAGLFAVWLGITQNRG